LAAEVLAAEVLAGAVFFADAAFVAVALLTAAALAVAFVTVAAAFFAAALAAGTAAFAPPRLLEEAAAFVPLLVFVAFAVRPAMTGPLGRGALVPTSAIRCGEDRCSTPGTQR
jgi:hypothetical protein